LWNCRLGGNNQNTCRNTFTLNSHTLDRIFNNYLTAQYNLSYTIDMKTAISLPDPLFKSAERAAHRLRMSRSRFFAAAASHYIREIHRNDVTERLNAVYGGKEQHDSRLPESIAKMQMTTIKKEQW
jgi:hypothetical protein